MPPEIVVEEVVKLLDGVQAAAGRDQSTSGQSFIKDNILSSVKLVDGHLPHGEGLARALATIASTLVRNPKRNKGKKVKTWTRLFIQHACIDCFYKTRVQ